ncbi:related to PRP4 - U4/U6 small nuclear ribonucleoprotein [Melanopsichium pennsylvanicum]|uniref:Related to PRP4 - U4/U6 small nuclear ribonucleoprotein n=2 Tax=Melanopsichium pennsylvanicum TaxID=63383 RepID=A0AAJ4XT84_9BASI|nr:related to PRP4-U4/U6 small nuclear ribonucleoprotein [Melanopsichium pennsylvanicum 4]SNX87501.1 related to PRP4 - U4/U6 small nuclear ribonucleoprotein [Melanopsichium pennsylvanicum]
MAKPDTMDFDLDPPTLNNNPSTSDSGITIQDLLSSSSRSNFNAYSATDAALSAQIDARKLARSLAIPTSDPKVRLRLRELGEPTTCFGEREMDRRERLRQILAQRLQQQQQRAGSSIPGPSIPRSQASADNSASDSSEEEEEEEFYTEGPPSLLSARRKFAAFSLQRSKKRLEAQRRESTVALTSIVNTRKKLFKPMKNFTNLGSQIGDDRPVSMTRFAPNSQLLATGSWSGSIKLWQIPSATHQTTLRGHTDKVGGLAWHPKATLTQDSGAVNLVSGAGDANVCLWSLQSDRPLATLQGHEARVARTVFHPTGDYVASASFDGTWRLWDVASTECLTIQEGHSKEVYSVEFQDDGALLASGGLDAIGRVWDMRTGRTAMVLDGHAKEILSIDFAPNGYQLATASGDDTVRIWDMRALKSIYTMPAHKSSVSDLRFFRSLSHRKAPFQVESPEQEPRSESESDTPMISSNGLYLATSGYDGMVRIWSADDWQLLRTLSGGGGRVMSVDISSDGEMLVSGEWSRTFKLWGSL